MQSVNILISHSTRCSKPELKRGEYSWYWGDWLVTNLTARNTKVGRKWNPISVHYIIMLQHEVSEHRGVSVWCLSIFFLFFYCCCSSLRKHSPCNSSLQRRLNRNGSINVVSNEFITHLLIFFQHFVKLTQIPSKSATPHCSNSTIIMSQRKHVTSNLPENWNIIAIA